MTWPCCKHCEGDGCPGNYEHTIPCTCQERFADVIDNRPPETVRKDK